MAGEALTYIPRKAIVPVSRSGGCHFLLTYRSASCAQYTEHIRIKNIVVVLHIVTKQSSKFELYAGKGGQAMSLTKLVSQGAVDNCNPMRRRVDRGSKTALTCYHRVHTSVMPEQLPPSFLKDRNMSKALSGFTSLPEDRRIVVISVHLTS